MSRRAGKDDIDETELQRLRDEEEAARIKARQLEIEQQPNPPEVLQYASPLFLPYRELLSAWLVTQESRRTTSGET